MRASSQTVFGRSFLLLVAFCVFGNTVQASLCAIDDLTSPAQHQAGVVTAQGVPDTAEDDGCLFCFGCAHGGSCCSLSLAPAYCFSLPIGVAASASSTLWTSRLTPQLLPFEFLRPPIAI